mgnify:CR=1 FL=1
MTFQCSDFSLSLILEPFNFWISWLYEQTKFPFFWLCFEFLSFSIFRFPEFSTGSRYFDFSSFCLLDFSFFNQIKFSNFRLSDWFSNFRFFGFCDFRYLENSTFEFLGFSTFRFLGFWILWQLDFPNFRHQFLN